MSATVPAGHSTGEAPGSSRRADAIDGGFIAAGDIRRTEVPKIRRVRGEGRDELFPVR